MNERKEKMVKEREKKGEKKEEEGSEGGKEGKRLGRGREGMGGGKFKVKTAESVL